MLACTRRPTLAPKAHGWHERIRLRIRSCHTTWPTDTFVCHKAGRTASRHDRCRWRSPPSCDREQRRSCRHAGHFSRAIVDVSPGARGRLAAYPSWTPWTRSWEGIGSKAAWERTLRLCSSGVHPRRVAELPSDRSHVSSCFVRLPGSGAAASAGGSLATARMRITLGVVVPKPRVARSPKLRRGRRDAFRSCSARSCRHDSWAVRPCVAQR